MNIQFPFKSGDLSVESSINLYSGNIDDSMDSRLLTDTQKSGETNNRMITLVNAFTYISSVENT